MKIIIINKTDVQGGAAIAANRIKNALCSIGESAKMLVQKKLSDDKSVHQNSEGKWARSKEFVLFIAERLFFYFYEKSKLLRFAFSPAVAGENISKNPLINEADIVHIHWFNQGFLSLKSLKKLLKLNKPIVWTLHDMWAFTGGCHYSGDCQNFKTDCGNCQFLKKPKLNDLSAQILRKKMKILKGADIQFVTCSNWLADKAKESILLKEFNIKSIPNPIDTGLYCNKNKTEIREKLKLPIDKKLVLFGAANIMDERKGLKYLLSALQQLKQEQETIDKTLEIVLFGKSDANFIKQIPFKVHDMGVISGDSNIVEIYNAADIFVLPSLEDNLPNTIMEAMACGTPVVAFNTGGVPEMIEHQTNGYLAEYKSVEGLMQGIEFFLNYSNYEALSKIVAERVYNNYNQKLIAKKYLSLFETIILQKQKKLP